MSRVLAVKLSDAFLLLQMYRNVEQKIDDTHFPTDGSKNSDSHIIKYWEKTKTKKKNTWEMYCCNAHSVLQFPSFPLIQIRLRKNTYGQSCKNLYLLYMMSESGSIVQAASLPTELLSFSDFDWKFNAKFFCLHHLFRCIYIKN